KVICDRTGCHHVSLLTSEAVWRWPRPLGTVLDLKERHRCHWCGRKGQGVVSIKWREQGAEPLGLVYCPPGFFNNSSEVPACPPGGRTRAAHVRVVALPAPA